MALHIVPLASRCGVWASPAELCRPKFSPSAKSAKGMTVLPGAGPGKKGRGRGARGPSDAYNAVATYARRGAIRAAASRSARGRSRTRMITPPKGSASRSPVAAVGDAFALSFLSRHKEKAMKKLIATPVAPSRWRVAFIAMKKKDPASVSGIPGIGALLPNSSLVPEKWRGTCSPAWLDAAVWGTAGAAAGYYLLAGKKLF